MYNKPVKIDSSILASRLKNCREERNVTKAEMAHDLNIAPSSMTYYESGQAIPSIDKLYAIADYLNTSIDYLAGRMDKSVESVRTEKDVAEFITRLTDYEGINLLCDEEGTPVLSFESEVLNDFLKNRIEIEDLKKEAGNTDIPEKFFNEMFKSKNKNETYYLRDMAERQLTLKDGSNNATIRRKRRLAGGELADAAQTVADGVVRDKPNKHNNSKAAATHKSKQDDEPREAATTAKYDYYKEPIEKDDGQT